jgi:hypothetical protein
MAVGCPVLDYPGLERPQATRRAGQSWALISTSGFSLFWAEDRAEVRAVQCRRVVFSIERLGLRRRGQGQSWNRGSTAVRSTQWFGVLGMLLSPVAAQ